MENTPGTPSARGSLVRLLAGSVCISFAPIFVKLATVSPDVAGFYRMLFAGGSLAALMLVKGMRPGIPRKPMGYLVIGGVFLAVDFMCWHRSIHLVGPGLATLLANFQVFFTAVFSFLFLKQRVGWLFMLAVLLALGGLSLITGVDWHVLDAGMQWGILLGFATAVLYSGYILFLKGAMNHAAVTSFPAMFMVSVASTLLLGAVTPLTGASFAIPDVTSVLALVGIGVVSTTLGWSLISSAVKHTPATIAGLVLLLQPTLAFVWEVILFNRPTTLQEVFGILLILSAIYLGAYRK